MFVLGLTRSHLILEQQLATHREFFKATPRPRLICERDSRVSIVISNKQKTVEFSLFTTSNNQQPTTAFHIKIRDYLVQQTLASNKRQL